MKSIEQNVEQFLATLAARTPTPGGGSASALGGALGAALGSMAAVFTTQNEKYKSVEAQALELDRQFVLLRKKFETLIQQDIDAYGAYCSARALPKETAEEKAARKAALAAASETATQIPEQMIGAALEGMRLTEELAKVANPNLAGDVAVAAYFLEAAARGAGVQVFSNCATDDPEGKNLARRQKTTASIAACQQARQRIDEAVLRLLKIAP